MTDLYDVIARRRDVRADTFARIKVEGVLESSPGRVHALGGIGERGIRARSGQAEARERSVLRRVVRTPPVGMRGRGRRRRERGRGPGVVVTYDPARGGPAALGKHAIADTGLYSVCLAIQNLWLAATAEGLGVGWVSFYREDHLAGLVGLPDGVRPLAWLCLGPVREQQTVPDLVRHGWRERRPLDDAVHLERWGRTGAAS